MPAAACDRGKTKPKPKKTASSPVSPRGYNIFENALTWRKSPFHVFDPIFLTLILPIASPLNQLKEQSET